MILNINSRFLKNKGVFSNETLPTRSMDQGLDYVNSIVETNMASRMGSGTVRAYSQSLTLQMMPVNLIGVAISTAFFRILPSDWRLDVKISSKKIYSLRFE